PGESSKIAWRVLLKEPPKSDVPDIMPTDATKTPITGIRQNVVLSKHHVMKKLQTRSAPPERRRDYSHNPRLNHSFPIHKVKQQSRLYTQVLMLANLTSVFIRGSFRLISPASPSTQSASQKAPAKSDNPPSPSQRY